MLTSVLSLSDDGPRSVPPSGLVLQKLVQLVGSAGRQRFSGLLLSAVSIKTDSFSNMSTW